eukprot:scaffold12470_cov119-Isochrysis_galbana.AAC.16
MCKTQASSGRVTGQVFKYSVDTDWLSGIIARKKGKIFSRNARHASGGSTGHLKSIAYRSLPLSLSHSFPTPFSLFRPSVAEGWCQSCVHHNSLGWGIESLGFSVVLNPMSASLSTSLRADYGGALDIYVAIFGRADQHSAGAEGAPYRLSIVSGIARADGLALWLTILPCAGSRGRFGDDWNPMSMSVDPEAEGAARASAPC